MFTGGNQIAMDHVGFTDRFLLSKLFVYQSQRLCAVARAPVGSDRIVEGKHAFSFGCCLFRISQSAFVVARLDKVMGQRFHADMSTDPISLQAFRRVAMQAATTNGIHFFIKDLADLVMGKDERVSAVSADQLSADSFIQRVEQSIFALIGGSGL